MVARFLLALALGLPMLGFGQAFNGNFESLEPNGLPTAWKIADPSGAATSNDGHIGKRCAKAWVYKNFESGIWTSASSLADANASEVTGYYKYLGERSECDKAIVSYLLGAKTATGGIDTLAFGATELKLSKEYRKFELSVSSMGAGDPEIMSIQIMPRGNCNVHGQTNCCFLYVDDIILAGSTTLESAPAPTAEGEIAPTAEEEIAPKPEKERKAKKGKGKGDDAAPLEVTPATEEMAAPANEEVAPEKPVTPTEGKVAPVEEKVAPPAAVPADEEEEEEEGSSGEPLEGWESEEESSDGGQD